MENTFKGLDKINFVVIGYGYWGTNLARAFSGNSNYNLVGICDEDENQQNQAQNKYHVNVYADPYEVDCSNVDLAIIATRPGTHFEIASFFLNNQINVLLTKPVTKNINDAISLRNLARLNNVQLFCDYTYAYSRNIDFLIEYFRKNQSWISQYSSYRTALGIVQGDVSVVEDLAVHDISILMLIKNSIPLTTRVISTNALESNVVNYPHEVAICFVWEDGFSAFLHVSWNSPKKTRIITLKGKKQSLVIEELERQNPIKIINYDLQKNDLYENTSLSSRVSQNTQFAMGNIEIPVFDQSEPLSNEAEVIYEFLRSGESRHFVADIDYAIRIWQMVDMAKNRLKESG